MVDDRPITREAMDQWTRLIQPVVETTHASLFEATTAVAFADLAARGVDIAVIEVGLGGRLDATNVISPLVSAITKIALDHTDYLGDTLEDIAREKAGIAKAGRPLVIGETDPELADIIEEIAIRAGSLPVRVPPTAEYRAALRLEGAHQRRNAAVAAAILAQLPRRWHPGDEAIHRAFARTRVPGRFDRRGKWIFDVAHNPNGVEALVTALREARPARPIHALVGILGDKDWATMLGRLGEVVDRIWVTNPPTAPPDREWKLAEVGQRMGPAVRVEPGFDIALQEVQGSAGTILVTGSFHPVGDALARIPGFAPLG